MKPTKEQRKQLEKENAKYPWKLVEIPFEKWAASLQGLRNRPVKLFRSREFLVQVYAYDNYVVRLSVNRTSHNGNRWDDMITWDELQAIKRQAGYGDYDAVEVFPRDVDIVNVSNIRHLFVFCDRRDLPFVWRKE